MSFGDLLIRTRIWMFHNGICRNLEPSKQTVNSRRQWSPRGGRVDGGRFVALYKKCLHYVLLLDSRHAWYSISQDVGHAEPEVESASRDLPTRATFSEIYW